MFLWGAATSSHQVDGNNIHSDWWAWEKEGHCARGDISGDACDHYHRYAQDLQLLKDLGLNSYRFSVEWARIEPSMGAWNKEALDHYSQVVDECLRLGITPMVTLHHFTLPKWFADQGGFSWSRAPEHFETYAAKVVERLGSRVKLWVVFNEPMVMALGQWVAGFMPPAKFDLNRLRLTIGHLIQSQVRVYQQIHAQQIHTQGFDDVQVGTSHNMIDFQADRSWHPGDQFLRRAFHRFYNLAWLDAVTGKKQLFGVPGLLKSPPVVRSAVGVPSVDFIGVNYYTKALTRMSKKPVGDQAEFVPDGFPVQVLFRREGDVASDLGWALHPKGFEKVLRRAARYGLPLYVTENGCADKDGGFRPTFIDEHLNVVEALRSKIDLRGYYHWSLMDNFEWIEGNDPRFGLYRVDYPTQQRTLTAGGNRYRERVKMLCSGSTTPIPTSKNDSRGDNTRQKRSS